MKMKEKEEEEYDDEEEENIDNNIKNNYSNREQFGDNLYILVLYYVCLKVCY